MNNFIKALGILIFSCSALRAQEINGVVYDKETKKSISGCTISIVNQPSRTTKSDTKGAFKLIVNTNETLLITNIGYKESRKKITTVELKNPLAIYLEPGIGLNEVLVTASLANSRSKKTLGANIEHISAESIVATKDPTSLADIINGRVSGVQVYNTNGKIGMPIRFNVRSAATFSMERDPLIFVDGVRYNSNNTADINSSQEAMSALIDLPLNDIVSIDVIKGPAAAASYGTEAANGVIVIKTKRGTLDKEGLSVNVKYTGGASQLTKKYDQFVNNDPLNNFFVKGNQQQLYANIMAQLNQNNSLFFSANTNKSSGIVPGNIDNRLTFRSGYDYSKNNFKISAIANYVNGKLGIPQTASGRDDAIWNLMRDQTPWPFISEDSWRAIQKEYKNDRFTASLKLGYTFPFAIKMESLVGLDLNYINGLNYLPFGYLQGTNNTGTKQESIRRNQNLNWDLKLSKNFTFNPKWQLNLSLLSQLTKINENLTGVSVRNFAIPNINNLASAAEILGITDTDFEKRTHGIYGEAFLNYDNKLFINAGLRRDISNLIGRNVASIYYPTVSVTYNFGQLAIFNGKIDEWKLRAAYGESGRLPYPNDAQTAYLVENSSFGSIVKPLRMGNPAIKPERTSEFEIGTDISLFKQRLSFTYYSQRTRDAIVYTTLIPSLGWPSTLSGDYPENIGRINGKGIELSINSSVFTSKNNKHSLGLFAIFNHQTNKVINSGGKDILSLVNLIREGSPAFAFYTTESEGAIFNSSGVYTGAKESGLKEFGTPFPTYNGSFGFSLQLFKYFNLQSLFNYSAGAKVYNISMRNVAMQGTNLNAKETLKTHLATLTPNTADYISTANQLAKFEGIRGDFIENADFLRLSNLTLSYDLGTWATQQSNGVLKRCVLSITGNNLWLKTNYGGAEPQIDSQGGSKRNRGISYLSADWTTVPPPKTFALSLNIGF